MHFSYLFINALNYNIEFIVHAKLAMYGDAGKKLVLDAKRSLNLNDISLFQGDLIKDIVREIDDLNNDAEYLTLQQRLQEESQDISEEEQKVNQCQLFVTHLSMRRNKRCLLAYQKLRADQIDEFSWLNIDPDQQVNDRTDSSVPRITRMNLSNLSHEEAEYFRAYQEVITNYKSNFADIDLSGDLEPPTSIFIDVRVLKDGGEVQTEYGVFNLIKDSQFYVRKSDVERLIQQGYLEEL